MVCISFMKIGAKWKLGSLLPNNEQCRHILLKRFRVFKSVTLKVKFCSLLFLFSTCMKSDTGLRCEEILSNRESSVISGAHCLPKIFPHLLAVAWNHISQSSFCYFWL